ncbi:MAG TPA: hypothetical protein PKZ32_02715, partial [Candidatus Melainabacteria bacterium]|nr:hypothetical protein [Candidatus Melainabacteria bacterium]
MDSALSSNQNEQVVSKNGKASSENTDRENEFEDNQHLLYGGASASAPEQKTESNMAVGARPGQPLQHARESTESLNLVALAGLAETVKADGRPPSSTPTYESGLSNPLPAIAKTGVAATLGLQAPTSDNAIPAGRRSGATDKIAIQLADDVAARPAMGQEIQLSQLDRDTKHRIVNASVNNLFERLGQPVPSGPADENARPIAVTAATRRSNSGENQVATVTTPARTDIRPASETPSGTRTAAELMATRAA